jgi:3'-phosphoadenosine 5'-phosphosulfate sulfotransferase (PAPS reductase)/FAD synthetase
MTTVFYNFSGGMESAAMLVIDRERIRDTGAIVSFADTGKQFPEMAESIKQIESILGLSIVTVPRRITFDEFLFEKGGMLRKGMTDCSRRMKRSNLARHMNTFPRPYEVNLGFNRDEVERQDDFIARNERPWLHWRFPLIEADISRRATWGICERAGFTILIEMYEKMGRFDCFWCPNQQVQQARKVGKYYPELAAEWIAAEKRKGHAFLSAGPLESLIKETSAEERTAALCACFGGTESIADEIEAELGAAP